MTREELYGAVWTTPLSRLAEEYGISGNGLAKICDRENIPYDSCSVDGAVPRRDTTGPFDTTIRTDSGPSAGMKVRPEEQTEMETITKETAEIRVA